MKPAMQKQFFSRPGTASARDDSNPGGYQFPGLRGP